MTALALAMPETERWRVRAVELCIRPSSRCASARSALLRFSLSAWQPASSAFSACAWPALRLLSTLWMAACMQGGPHVS